MQKADLESPLQDNRPGSADQTARSNLTVCLITDSHEPSGVGEQMLALGATLRARGSRVLFICTPSASGGRYIDRAAGLGLETLAVDWGRPRARQRFAEWVSARRVDVCHVHAGIAWESLDIPAAARIAGVPVVVRTEHLPYLLTDESDHARYTAALRHVDKIVCVSHGARDSFIIAGVPASAITVIYNGIEARPADRDRVRVLLGLDALAPMVLTVARYTPQKGHRTLLDAVPSVLAREPQARFAWVGTGPLEATMHEMVRKQGLDRHVLLLGQRDDVPDFMAAADLFALPSLFEGLPLAVLEAMAAALPVVASRVCGTEEAVQDGVTGLLVEPGNPEALAFCLSELLSKPQWAAQLGARGRERVEQAFSLSRVTRETLALYHDLLSRQYRLPFRRPMPRGAPI
jgi:glycosyltransferase involved in cell wall biosynthesis